MLPGQAKPSPATTPAAPAPGAALHENPEAQPEPELPAQVDPGAEPLDEAEVEQMLFDEYLGQSAVLIAMAILPQLLLFAVAIPGTSFSLLSVVGVYAAAAAAVLVVVVPTAIRMGISNTFVPPLLLLQLLQQAQRLQ